MYVQSIKLVKHNAAKSVNRSILKKSRRIEFGVCIVHSSMVRTSGSMIEIREKEERRYARQHVAISRQSCWGVEGAGHKVHLYVEYRALSGVFQIIDSPTPSLTHSPGGEGVEGQYFVRRQTLDWPLSTELDYSRAGVDKLKQSGQCHAPPTLINWTENTY